MAIDVADDGDRQVSEDLGHHPQRDAVGEHDASGGVPECVQPGLGQTRPYGGDLQRPPNSVVNTNAVSCQAVPARDRSSAWVASDVAEPPLRGLGDPRKRLNFARLGFGDDQLPVDPRQHLFRIGPEDACGAGRCPLLYLAADRGLDVELLRLAT
jgi:hypothetical protein